MSVNNIANGPLGSIQAKDTVVEGDTSLLNEESHVPVGTDLPLIGDYVGIGGPDAVPLETQGAFEKPEKAASSLLDELFMSPTDTQLLSVHRTKSNNEISQNKSRLKWVLSSHILLFVLMAMKLFPEVLDQLDIFILEVEELLIPKPQLWEWIWASSIVPTIIAWSACKKSNAFNMKIFQALNIFTGLLPIFLGMSYHFSDFYEIVAGDGEEMISKWMGIPTSVLWYVFFFVTLQIHVMELCISNILVYAWTPKKNN